MKKKFVILALAGMMAVTSLTGCSGIKESDVVATVSGDDITADVANFFARYTQAQYETYFAGYLGDDMWASEAVEGKTYEENVKDSVMEGLENMYLMEDHMEDYKVTLTEEEKKAIKAAAADFDEANALDQKEKVSGSTETVERILTLLTIQQKMQTAIGDTADQEVSDDEAKQKKMQYVSYPFTTTDDEGNSVDLTEEEKTALLATAEEFAEGAKKAEDFSAYATEQGAEAADAAFDAESTTLPAELVEAADALKEGETTAVVESSTGYYVAKVTSLFDKEATEAKKESIISERKQEKIQEVLDGWKKEADIKVDEKVWKKIDFNDLTVTMKQDESEPYEEEPQTDDQAEKETDGQAEEDAGNEAE